ncbi:MAG TPA: DUF3147 family protein [Patescibacteria group bacterium]|jgi:hypothetical protein
MTSEEIALKALLSFVTGGFYVALMTFIAEKFGSKVGGVLLALPSTALVGLAFIGLTLGSSGITEAASVMPAPIGVSMLFVSMFVIFYRFGGLIPAYLASVICWFAMTIVLVHWDMPFILSVLLGLLFAGVSVSYLRKKSHRKLPPLHFSRTVFVTRTLFAGAFVGIAVLFASLLGPIWGGLFSSFPAVFSATLLILTRSHGIEFMASTGKAMVLGGLANLLFVIAVYGLVPLSGPILGITLAYLAALLFAAGTYRFVLDRV